MRKKSQLFNGDHDGGGLDDMIKNIFYCSLSLKVKVHPPCNNCRQVQKVSEDVNEETTGGFGV